MVLYIFYVSLGVLFIVERQDRPMGYRPTLPLGCAGTESYDPDALRLGPTTSRLQVDSGAHAKRKAARDRLFIPNVAWPELAAVVAAGMSGRAVGLWLAIRMQAKLDGGAWVGVRTHLRESLGFTNRAAHSRAVAELERGGLIELQRRKGYAPLVRLVPRHVRGGNKGGD